MQSHIYSTMHHDICLLIHSLFFVKFLYSPSKIPLLIMPCIIMDRYFTRRKMVITHSGRRSNFLTKLNVHCSHGSCGFPSLNITGIITSVHVLVTVQEEDHFLFKFRVHCVSWIIMHMYCLIISYTRSRMVNRSAGYKSLIT